jgi:hypothetical protein
MSTLGSICIVLGRRNRDALVRVGCETIRDHAPSLRIYSLLLRARLTWLTPRKSILPPRRSSRDSEDVLASCADCNSGFTFAEAGYGFLRAGVAFVACLRNLQVTVPSRCRAGIARRFGRRSIHSKARYVKQNGERLEEGMRPARLSYYKVVIALIHANFVHRSRVDPDDQHKKEGENATVESEWLPRPSPGSAPFVLDWWIGGNVAAAHAPQFTCQSRESSAGLKHLLIDSLTQPIAACLSQITRHNLSSLQPSLILLRPRAAVSHQYGIE